MGSRGSTAAFADMHIMPEAEYLCDPTASSVFTHSFPVGSVTKPYFWVRHTELVGKLKRSDCTGRRICQRACVSWEATRSPRFCFLPGRGTKVLGINVISCGLASERHTRAPAILDHRDRSGRAWGEVHGFQDTVLRRCRPVFARGDLCRVAFTRARARSSRTDP